MNDRHALAHFFKFQSPDPNRMYNLLYFRNHWVRNSEQIPIQLFS